jgi:hypothetical protein
MVAGGFFLQQSNRDAGATDGLWNKRTGKNEVRLPI